MNYPQHHKQTSHTSSAILVVVVLSLLVVIISSSFLLSTSAKADTSALALFDPYVVYPATSYGRAVAIGDFNNDSLNDVALTTLIGADKLYLFSQTVSHTLVASDQGTIPYGTSSIISGDFNQDQRTDLAYVSNITPSIFVRQQNSSGSLDAAINYATAINPSQLVADDINRDSKTDIVVTHSGSPNLGVFLQQLNGGFGNMANYSTTEYASNDADTGDFNADGRKDILLRTGSLLEIYTQSSDGKFAPTYANRLKGASSIAVGDLTRDGLDDFVVTIAGNRPNSKLALFAQTSTGTFVQSALYDSYDIPEVAKTADINLDGRLDVVVYHSGWMMLGVYLQQSNGGLGSEVLYSIPYIPTMGAQNMAIGDVTGDGLPDVAIAGFDQGLVILPHKALATPTPTVTPTFTPAPPTSTPFPSPTPISSLTSPMLYMSFQSSALVGSVLPSDEDIVSFDAASGKWGLVFDGSVVKLTTANLNSLQTESDGSLLFTLVATATVPGIGEVTPADIVRFIPTSLGKGTATQGSYQLVLDGSDAGLDTFDSSGVNEGIDALSRTPDGKLLISTAGSFAVPALSGDDEDLFAFTPTSLGATSAGTWSLYLDGSDVDLGESNEDIQNLWLDPTTGNLYIMAAGATVNGGLDDGDDIWVCHPLSLGDNSQCIWQRYWDGDYFGVDVKIVDALDIAIAPPPLPTATPTLFATKTPTPVPTSTPLPTATALPSPTPVGGLARYINLKGSGTVGGIAFTDEDILAQDLTTGAWSLVFDGSDVGIPDAAQLDGTEIEADGSLLLSFAADTTLPTVGLVAPMDIVRFVPTRLGADTAGNFALYFDGSDVELAASGENIDAIARASDGRLLISVTGSFFDGVLSASDEDLLAFSPTSLGDTTSGTWQMYFDGSDVGLSLTTEDTQGAWMDSGKLYLSMEGAFDVGGGVVGDGNDILVCTPTSLGTTTACTYQLLWDGNAHGLASAVLGGIEIGPATLPSYVSTASSLTARMLADVLPLPSTAIVDEEITGEEICGRRGHT